MRIITLLCVSCLMLGGCVKSDKQHAREQARLLEEARIAAGVQTHRINQRTRIKSMAIMWGAVAGSAVAGLLGFFTLVGWVHSRRAKVLLAVADRLESADAKQVMLALGHNSSNSQITNLLEDRR